MLAEKQQPQQQQHDGHGYEERQQTPAALHPGPHGRYFLRGLGLREPFFMVTQYGVLPAASGSVWPSRPQAQGLKSCTDGFARHRRTVSQKRERADPSHLVYAVSLILQCVAQGSIVTL